MTDKINTVTILENRLQVLQEDGREDLEIKLKEMSHLLELERLERGNMEAELCSIKQQRDTWNSYFDRRKDEENDYDTIEDETETVTDANIGTKKSPRKKVGFNFINNFCLNNNGKIFLRCASIKTIWKKYGQSIRFLF